MDLPTWNARNACKCPCGFPTCDPPTSLCESLSHTSTCADNDYTDSMAVWNAKVAAHAAWVTEHASYPSRHAAWVTEHATWASCVITPPCSGCGPEPVEPVDPPEPPTPGTEPTKPDGYDDVTTRGCYLPYKRPAGELADEIVTVYQTETVFIDKWTYDGQAWTFESYAGSPGSEILDHGTFHMVDFFGPDSTWAEVGSGNVYDGPTADPSCYPFPNPSGGFLIGVTDPFSVEYEMGAPTEVCDPTEMSSVVTGTSTQGDGASFSLQGCPGPFPAEDREYAWDYTYESRTGRTLGSGVTKSDVASRARSNLPSTWPDEPAGADCVATMEIVWPTIADGLGIYLDRDGDYPPEEPPPDPAWPVCFSPSLPVVAGGQATARKVRYKRGIPLKYQAHRLWIIAHAAWVVAMARFTACETEGDPPEEPVEPKIFHYWAEQWDVVKFPKKWEAWRVLWLAWKAAVKAHEDWVTDHAAWVTAGSDPDTEPVEPVVPADPTDDQPDDRPVFIDENLFWEWTGGETLATQYEPEWRFIAAPTDEARVSIVNSQVMCFKSERTGVPLTSFGEIYNPDDYPA